MTAPVGLPREGWIRERVLLELRVVPWKRTRLREEVAKGNFPAPRRFSARTVAWSCEAIHQWIAEQSGKTTEVKLAMPKARPVRVVESVAA